MNNERFVLFLWYKVIDQVMGVDQSHNSLMSLGFLRHFNSPATMI